MRQFDYSVAEQRDSVVVVGAGPSLVSNLETTVQYTSQNNSVVLVGNYHYAKLPATYTYFSDQDKYLELINKTPCSNIIVRYSIAAAVGSDTTSGRNYFVVGSKRGEQCIYKASLRINEDGSFSYNGIGSAGFGSILLATVFRPKHVLLVGFDGGTGRTRQHYDGHHVVTNNRYQVQDYKSAYLSKTLLPFLRSLGIDVRCYANDPLWGISKKRLSIIG